MLIDNWSIKVNKTKTEILDSGWNANYIEKENVLIFSNASYNSTILPDNQVAVSFVVKTTNSNYQPTTNSFEFTE